MNSLLFFQNAGIENILLLSVGTINFVFSLVVYLIDRKNQKNILFSLVGISVSLWAFSMGVFNLTTNPTLFYISANWLYFSASSAFFFFFFLSTSLEKGTIELSFWKKVTAVVFFVIVIVIVNIQNFVIIVPENIGVRELRFGPGYLLYGLYIVAYFLSALFGLVREYKHLSNSLTKKQVLFLSTGTLISVLIGLNTNLIFPFLGIWRWFWVGPVATVIMVIFVGYSTVRHNFFNNKSVAAESVSFLLCVAMLMRIFLSSSVQDFILNGILFILISGGGYILIVSIYKEIKTREGMEKLAQELEAANEHLRVLDKQKSEFVSIASHQLRTPLTAIIGYSSMLLEGSYGKLPKKAIETIDKVYQSGRRLATTIDDFLTISHIEQGKMVYTFTTVEMKKVLTEIMEGFSTQAKERKMKMKFTTDDYDTYNVTADDNKIRQVLLNLIDNAIKYGKEGEPINVFLSKNLDTRKTRIAVKDNGIGMSEKTISNLFQKFSRAEGVRKVYTDGSGLGLYVASEMIKEHHGQIWVESEGEGKGSTFFIELMSEE